MAGNRQRTLQQNQNANMEQGKGGCAPVVAGSSFVELIASFTGEIRELKELTLLRSIDATKLDSLREVDTQLVEIERKLSELKFCVSKEKQHIQTAQNLQEMMQQQQTRVAALEATIPIHMRTKPATNISNKNSILQLTQQNQTASNQDHHPQQQKQQKKKQQPKSSDKENVHSDSNAPAQVGAKSVSVPAPEKRSTRKGPKYVVPPIQQVTKEELDGCSSYMRGRLTPEKVNAAIAEIIEVVQEKYRILMMPPNKMGTSTRAKYQSYKQQQDDAKGLIFFTEEDLRATQSVKTDATGKAIMSVLQTLGRVKVEGARQKRYVLPAS